MKYKKLNLLIPCYRGKELFKRAILSLIPFVDNFDKVIISFNGVQNDLKQWVEDQVFLSNDKLVIWEITNEVSSKEHLAIICSNGSNIIADDEFVFLMAHDDTITDFSLNKSLLNKKIVFFPTYNIKSKQTHIQRKYDEYLSLIKKDQLINCSDWIWRCYDKFNYTNMTGMIVPFFVLNDVSENLKLKLTGSRFEAMLATNKSIDSIMYLSSVKVDITTRDDSDGNTIEPLESRIDEIIFLKYLKKNMSFKNKDFVKINFIHLKKYLSFLMKGGKLGN